MAGSRRSSFTSHTHTHSADEIKFDFAGQLNASFRAFAPLLPLGRRVASPGAKIYSSVRSIPAQCVAGVESNARYQTSARTKGRNSAVCLSKQVELDRDMVSRRPRNAGRNQREAGRTPANVCEMFFREASSAHRSRMWLPNRFLVGTKNMRKKKRSPKRWPFKSTSKKCSC